MGAVLKEARRGCHDPLELEFQVVGSRLGAESLTQAFCKQHRLLTAKAISPAGPQLLNSYSGMCLPNPTRTQVLGTCCSQNISLLSPHLGKTAVFLLEVALFPLSASKPSVSVSSTAFSLSTQASHLGQSFLLCQEAPSWCSFPDTCYQNISQEGAVHNQRKVF